MPCRNVGVPARRGPRGESLRIGHRVRAGAWAGGHVGDRPGPQVRSGRKLRNRAALGIDRDQAGRAEEGTISIRSLTKLPATLAALDLDKDRDAPRRLP